MFVSPVANLVAVSSDAHEEVIRLNVAMDEIAIMHILHAGNHLNMTQREEKTYNPKCAHTFKQ